MSAHNIVMAASGGSAEATYVDDVFSAYTYTPADNYSQAVRNGIDFIGTDSTGVTSKFQSTLYTGNGGTQTITNGVDLAGQGGLVWVKSRSSVTSNYLQDSARSNFANSILSDTTGAQWTSNYIVPTSTGFTTTGNTNLNTQPEVAWTFRKAPKFFDVVTYTGNGSARTISHSLGQAPGMIIIKRTDSTSEWTVYHRGVGNTAALYLQLTNAAFTSSVFWNNTDPTSSVFTVGTGTTLNANGASYVAYLFAHDSATDGIIQCGSFTTDGSGNATVSSLGWSPQYLMIKSSTNAANWIVLDTARGFTGEGNDSRLFPNLTNVESTTSAGDPTATGFTVTGQQLSQTHIYMAIRAPSFANGGGMVWTKRRDTTLDHFIADTARGGSNIISSNSTGASSVGTRILSFTNNGFTGVDNSGGSFASWSFKRAKKFFDVVTYTGDGTTNRQITHALGVSPGMVIIKKTSTTSAWPVYHTSTGTTFGLRLDSTEVLGSTQLSPVTAVSATTITLNKLTESSGTTDCNANGVTYIAYLFAHDSAADGIIQCGSFTTDGSGNATVSLGWEPQFILAKTSSTANSWYMLDVSRGMPTNGVSSGRLALYANSTDPDGEQSPYGPSPTATGFYVNGWIAINTTFVYMAIRRPNKPPTTGTQVYNAVARTGTSAVATVTGVGFAPDLLIGATRSNAGLDHPVVDRLRGTAKQFYITSSNAEVAAPNEINSLDMDGVTLGNASNLGYWNTSPFTFVHWFFKRAPGVFDMVCYKGTGANRTVTHNLGVVPELMIVKSRGDGNNWAVYQTDIWGSSNTLYLNLSSGVLGGSLVWNATPTASVFSVGTAGATNTSNIDYIAYLFASKAGISKIGSYTGNGGTQTINCGFSTGARFVMIKKTNDTGYWHLLDTTRGIIAGNDKVILANNTSAEDPFGAADSIDPDNSGFIVNQTTYDLNGSAQTYIYLAIA